MSEMFSVFLIEQKSRVKRANIGHSEFDSEVEWMSAAKILVDGLIAEQCVLGWPLGFWRLPYLDTGEFSRGGVMLFL